MICAIVPVKSLRLAKGRLSGVLSEAERRALVLAMLDDVLASLGAATAVDHVGVISADPGVLARAAALGADALIDSSADLNGALTQAAGHYAMLGATAALVVPADVPLVTAREFDCFAGTIGAGPGVRLAPARDGGTNALLVRPPLALPFLFGEGSLARHQAAASAQGIVARLVHLPGLALDVDQPDDLVLLAEAAGDTAAQRLARELRACERVMCV
jgi:2-phospho-L-lactate/phosphoenolpyruvate guanylyltransferase